MALGFWRRGKPENGGSAAEARPARVRALLGIALLSIAPAAALASCADEDPLPGKPSGGTGASAADGGPESCSEGAVEECHITVGENNGVLTCLDGMRSCEGGK